MQAKKAHRFQPIVGDQGVVIANQLGEMISFILTSLITGLIILLSQVV